jgi:hypothetical protein
VKTTNNHMVRDLESREDVPTPPSPNVAPDFALHDGAEVLRCLVVYGKEPSSPYAARVSSNIGH